MPLRADFLRITAGIVDRTVTTVDPDGWPRLPVMYPRFEMGDGVERLGRDRPDALEDRRIAANPVVSCSSWSPAQDTVTIDCAGYGARPLLVTTHHQY